jgi:hypothetical protein
MKSADQPPIEDRQINTTPPASDRGASQETDPQGPLASDRQAEEPCAVCRRETAIGSLLHDARRSLSAFAGGEIFVCANCVEDARASLGGEPLTDDNLRNFIRSASLAAIAWGKG